MPLVTRLEMWSSRTPTRTLVLMAIFASCVSSLPTVVIETPRPGFDVYANVDGKETKVPYAEMNLLAQRAHDKQKAKYRNQSVLSRDRELLMSHFLYLVVGLTAAAGVAGWGKKYGHDEESGVRAILLGLVVGFAVCTLATVLLRGFALTLGILDNGGVSRHFSASPVLGLLMYGASTWLFFSWRKRVTVGHCRKCDYLLRGLPTPVCPERGTSFDPDVTPDAFAEQ